MLTFHSWLKTAGLLQAGGHQFHHVMNGDSAGLFFLVAGLWEETESIIVTIDNKVEEIECVVVRDGKARGSAEATLIQRWPPN